MIRSFNGKTPNVAESAFVSEAAYVIGDIEIGDNMLIPVGSRKCFTSSPARSSPSGEEF